MDRPSMLKPTLIGGGVAGLLGGLPLIGAINACCCALIIGGGFLAAFLYSKECQGVGAEFRAGGAGWGLPDPDWPEGPLDARKATLLDILEDTGVKRSRSHR